MKAQQRESEILAIAFSEIQQRFANIDDLAHGWEHVHRVYTLALHIAEQEGADRFIVGMAALMHDLGRMQPDSTQHHANISVVLATELLTSYEVAPESQQAILHAIEAHSFSRGIEPRTIEAKVVRDADRLDGLGAIGVIRWAITGAMKATPQTYHPQDPFAETRIPDDHMYMLDHFYTKLLKMHDTMATRTGKQLAERRTNFLYTYINELRDAVAGA